MPACAARRFNSQTAEAGICLRRFKPIKKKINLTRRQKIGGSCLGAVCALFGLCGFLLDRSNAEWDANNARVTAISPDGAYVATTGEEWGLAGGDDDLVVKPLKPSPFAVLLSRLFSSSYGDSFSDVRSIQWVGRRTLRVEYDNALEEARSHPASWGDVKFQYRLVPPQ